MTEVEHSAVQQPAYRSRDNVGFAYENRFRAITSTVPYVPEHRTPKPIVYGLQTALVVDETSGGNSEEIWPDEVWPRTSALPLGPREQILLLVARRPTMGGQDVGPPVDP